MAEVSDSIHLRRFCRISLTERVPDESTVRKLTRRIGAETVNELTRSLIETAMREKRFRPRAVRIDSTVVEADVRYPTDADLVSHGVRVLAREGKKLATLVKERKARVRDRSRSMGRKLRASDAHDPPPVGGGEGGGAGVDRADRRAAGALGQGSAQARRGRQAPRGGRGAAAKRRAATELEELAGRCEKVATQIRQRVAGSRSPTGWCRSRIRTPARFARASSASRTCADSATIPRWTSRGCVVS